MYSLYDFQEQARDHMLLALRNGEHPVAQLPTGAGKSVLIADLARHLVSNGGRIIVAQHVDELIGQNYEAFCSHSGDKSKAGIVSAGLDRADYEAPVIFGSIQTLSRRLKHLPKPDAIFIDECHLVSLDNKMYPKLFRQFPEARRVGFSATPFRLDGTPVFGSDPATFAFSSLAHKITVKELVSKGYLCPLVGVTSRVQLELEGVKTTAGDFNLKQVDDRIAKGWLKMVLTNAISQAKNRNHCVVFCPTINVANLAREVFQELGEEAACVTSETEDRGELLDEWKAGKVRWMCNVNILTTGFNFQALDCIVFLRPTKSVIIWVQALGRGMRIFPGKENCLLLDYVGNLTRLGGVGIIDEDYVERPDGTLERDSDAKRAIRSGKKTKKDLKEAALFEIDPMTGKASAIAVEIEVQEVTYIPMKSPKRAASYIMVKYSGVSVKTGYPYEVSDFIFIEYDGWAKQKTLQWFAKRGIPTHRVPTSVDSRLISLCYSLPAPKRIHARHSGKYLNVCGEEF